MRTTRTRLTRLLSTYFRRHSSSKRRFCRHGCSLVCWPSSLASTKTTAGERLVDTETAQREIAGLYKDYVEDSNDGSGTRYLTGARMLQANDAPILIVKRLRLAGAKIEQRIQYLHRCLTFSCFLLNTAIQTAFDPAIKTSIAALGELLSTGFATASTLKRIPRAGVSFSFAWADRYLEDGGQIEKYMLAHGWCSSEVEKIRSINQGLGTRHYLSHMRRGGPQRDHSSCSKEGCVAFQIDASIYRPSHVRQGCSCHLQSVDSPQVLRVLQETSAYPVLRIHSTADDVGKTLEMAVEPYTEGVPYVAISHVSFPLQYTGISICLYWIVLAIIFHYLNLADH
jgi:hypothetical protein